MARKPVRPMCGTAKGHQSHQQFMAQEAGPVLGRHLVRIGWHGQQREIFAEELRELTVYRVPTGLLVEFASRLDSTDGPVRLDGDPQHAGFHFRADNEVANSTKDLTYYLRPDGVGEPGETRNWPNQSDFVNLPWNAMSFVLGDQRIPWPIWIGRRIPRKLASASALRTLWLLFRVRLVAQ